MAFFRKTVKMEYDPAVQEPVVRKSICTGEMSAGVIDRRTGVFREVMRLNGQKELEAFCKSIGVKEIRTIY